VGVALMARRERSYPPPGRPIELDAKALDWSRSPRKPFAHQLEDAAWLMGRRQALVASEMRTGKTKVAIDAAQHLFLRGDIDSCIVVAPQPVRSVWYDPELGQLQANLFDGLPATVLELHSKPRAWRSAAPGAPDRRMVWAVTNYEWLRSGLDAAMHYAGPRTMLILDESMYINSHKSQQTEAVESLRWACGRVALLNGTPIFHDPEDLFSQANVMHPAILNCRFISHFRSRYAEQKAVLRTGGEALTDKWGREVKAVSNWRPEGLEELRRLLQPWTVRRLQAECLDLPPRLEPVAMAVPMSAALWKQYCSMRDDLTVWLEGEGAVASATTAAMKVLRLAQITAGVLGGVEELPPSDDAFLDELVGPGPERAAGPGGGPTRLIDAPKLEALRQVVSQRLREDPSSKTVAWCKYRPEAMRAAEALREWFPGMQVMGLWGSQPERERQQALRLLRPETAPPGPAAVVGIYGTGSFGLDFTAASCSVAMSQEYSPGRHAQAAERTIGPAMVRPCAYFEVLATGPRGQKTIDHKIARARRAGEDVATWTSSAWVRTLREEAADA
jgi:hypothetical protein